MFSSPENHVVWKTQLLAETVAWKVIEGPVMAYIDGVEVPVHIMRSENQVELTRREKRNEKFDPDYMEPIASKEWFAEFYGRDLETDQPLASKQTTFYGYSGVDAYVNQVLVQN